MEDRDTDREERKIDTHIRARARAEWTRRKGGGENLDDASVVLFH